MWPPPGARRRAMRHHHAPQSVARASHNAPVTRARRTSARPTAAARSRGRPHRAHTAVAYIKFDKASSAALAIENLNGAVLNNGRGPKLKVLLAEAPTARCVRVGGVCFAIAAPVLRAALASRLLPAVRRARPAAHSDE